MEKRYYWIKLKTDFFNQNTIDFLLSQQNGCQYIVLYQMLCLNTANNNGEMSTRIGEIIVPYDVNKIVRDTKYFDFDTVTIALELFKKLGLIYEEENRTLKIANLEEMVGSESASREAIKKREYRLKKKIEENQKDRIGDIMGTNCPTEIEYRDKSIDIDIDNKKEIYKEKSFKKPTIDEIKAYCEERNNGINAEAFYDFYESKNWMIGKNKMKDFKACIRTWERRNTNKKEIPSWMNKNIKTEKMTIEEQKELDDILDTFK